MELEFDKEIDAILRKARRDTGVEAVKTAHIDADVIAAFAENALPEKAKHLYMEHFADCSHCRQLLSASIAWPPAEQIPKTVPVVSAVSVPWYRSLFRTPNLAMAMGALLLVFGGVLAFLVVDRKSAERNSTVSQVTNPETSADLPPAATLPAAPTAENSNLVTSNTAVNAAANTAAKSGAVSERAPGGRGPDNEPAATSGGITADGIDVTRPADMPRAAAMPPPVTLAQPGAEKSKDDEDKERRDRDLKLSKTEAETLAREVAPAQSRKVPVGPSRAAGPRQNAQNNTLDSNATATGVGYGSGSGSIAPVKTAGGKKFEKRDGAWYDTSYHGQATRDFSRGSEAYKALDSGLRSIASSIGGVVVVVWKGTAYRIQ